LQTRDEHIVSLLKSDPDQALSLLYDLYFDYLAGIVYRILPDESHTQDVVQGLFIEIWKKKDDLVINSSLKQYLRRSAINRTLNLIRSRSRIQDDVDPTEVVSFSGEVDQTLMLEAEELSNQIGAAIESLPERCRLIFSLSRYEDMSYREIAESLDISVKTVENQITKALKLMRDKLNKNI
jgi:RNA polymerase sigma-70 factor (ECF subfamily)